MNSLTENNCKGNSELCRRLSEIACDPATSSRLAKLVEELEHSLQEAEIQPQIRTQTQSRWTYGP